MKLITPVNTVLPATPGGAAPDVVKPSHDMGLNIEHLAIPDLAMRIQSSKVHTDNDQLRFRDLSTF